MYSLAVGICKQVVDEQSEKGEVISLIEQAWAEFAESWYAH